MEYKNGDMKIEQNAMGQYIFYKFNNNEWAYALIFNSKKRVKEEVAKFKKKNVFVNDEIVGV